MTPTVGAHEEQPPTGAQLGAQLGSQTGAQAGYAGAFSPRNKHDSQPMAGARRTNIAVTVNSRRMIYPLFKPTRLLQGHLEHENSTPGLTMCNFHAVVFWKQGDCVFSTRG
jgi:hypothetical protein